MDDAGHVGVEGAVWVTSAGSDFRRCRFEMPQIFQHILDDGGEAESRLPVPVAPCCEIID